MAAFAVGLLAAAASAQVSPATAPGPVAAASVEHGYVEGGAGWRLARVELLANAGYGGNTQHAYRVELEPYGASFGVEPGLIWKNGARLGAYTTYSLGREVPQRYEPLVRRDFDLTTEASSLHAGLSFGYDLPLYFLVLRYSLGLGFTRLSWDFDTRRPILGFWSAQGTAFGFHVAPGVALLWPTGLFECGLGFDYMVQSQDQLPSGALGRLLVGVKL